MTSSTVPPSSLSALAITSGCRSDTWGRTTMILLHFLEFFLLLLVHGEYFNLITELLRIFFSCVESSHDDYCSDWARKLTLVETGIGKSKYIHFNHCSAVGQVSVIPKRFWRYLRNRRLLGVADICKKRLWNIFIFPQVVWTERS